jgi:hypothetical protein
MSLEEAPLNEVGSENDHEHDDFSETASIKDIKDITPPPKPKRPMTDKQREALERGRKLGLEKLKARGEISKIKKETAKKARETEIQLSQLQIKEQAESVEDLKKLADGVDLSKKVAYLVDKINEMDGSVKHINTSFDSYLTEKQVRRKEKAEKTMEREIKKELPKTVSNFYMKARVNEALLSNPFIGNV